MLRTVRRDLRELNMEPPCQYGEHPARGLSDENGRKTDAGLAPAGG